MFVEFEMFHGQKLRVSRERGNVNIAVIDREGKQVTATTTTGESAESLGSLLVRVGKIASGE